MAKFLVRCANDKCKGIYYINEPDFPPNLIQKSFLDNMKEKLGLSQPKQNNKKIAYIFGCYECGVQNAVDLEPTQV